MEIFQEIKQIPVEQLSEHRDNQTLFSPLNETLYNELKEDIKLHGILQPLLIDESNNIVSGHNRWKIAKELNHDTVPCKVVKGSEAELKLRMIADNSLRRGHEKNIICLINQANHLSQFGTIRQGATSMGVTKSKFERYLKLNNLSDDFKVLLNNGVLTKEAGYAIAKQDLARQEVYYKLLSSQPKIYLEHVELIYSNKEAVDAKTWSNLKKKIVRQNQKYIKEIKELIYKTTDS